jgi:hypothetical protein
MIGSRDIEVDRLPVGTHRLDLEGDRQPAPSHQVVEEGPHRFDAQRVEQTERVLADDAAGVVTEQPLRRGAHEDEPSF